ncbi:MAG: HAD-IA family hydrolase, partial [bacterium]
KQLVEERGLPVFDGVFNLLDELEKAGATLAIATSGPREKVETSLRLTGLGARFGVVVSGDDVSRGKPAPDVFIEAARRCGVKPETCVGIEDTFPGLKAVRAAGMRVVAVAHTFPEQDLSPLCDRLFKRIGDISVSDLLDRNE